jgi:hypothetical protein
MTSRDRRVSGQFKAWRDSSALAKALATSKPQAEVIRFGLPKKSWAF